MAMLPVQIPGPRRRADRSLECAPKSPTHPKTTAQESRPRTRQKFGGTPPPNILTLGLHLFLLSNSICRPTLRRVTCNGLSFRKMLGVASFFNVAVLATDTR